MSGVQMITVAEGDGDQRVDRWLRRMFPHVSQGRIEKMCRKGELRVDGGRVKAATRLVAGQQVRVPPLPEEDHRPAPLRAGVSEADAEMIRACVIWRDDHIIALNKPPGLAVQGGSGQRRHVDALAEALMFGLEEKPRLVHRLDKDTSGVLLMARTRAVAAGLTAAFRHRVHIGCQIARLGTQRRTDARAGRLRAARVKGGGLDKFRRGPRACGAARPRRAPRRAAAR